MTHDEMIAVIQAHKDGKVIQVKLKNDAPGRGWENLRAHDPIWHFGRNTYRPKPEPKEYWLVPYTIKIGYLVLNRPPVKQPALYVYDLDLHKTIHVKEVIEELTND
jgi:hypothetical protein